VEDVGCAPRLVGTDSGRGTFLRSDWLIIRRPASSLRAGGEVVLVGSTRQAEESRQSTLGGWGYQGADPMRRRGEKCLAIETNGTGC